MNTSLRWCAMVSGAGSLLEHMLDEGLKPDLVIADRPCRGLDLAHERGCQTMLIRRTDFTANFDRASYTRQVATELYVENIDFVVMVGFMTVLDDQIFEEFAGRITNNHPALLPLFKGDHAVRDALEAGVTETGCTIHVATAKLDDGPIIAQERVPVLGGDTEETLHERIKQAERPLIAQVVRETLQGKRTLPGFALAS